MRNVEQSRAKRLVSRRSPPSTSQRRKWKKEEKKIERRKIEEKRWISSFLQEYQIYDAREVNEFCLFVSKFGQFSEYIVKRKAQNSGYA